MKQGVVLDSAVKKSIHDAVLCWLATASADGIPNVSPKEIFVCSKDDIVIIANIASPQSMRNIIENENVNLSFINILVQKGYQLKGKAQIIRRSDAEFDELAVPLEKLTEGLFPFDSIIKIDVHSVKSIIAPRYIFYPETSEEAQIESAKKSYRL